MFSKKGFVTVCLVILTALLITGCFPPVPPTPVAVTGVTLNHAAMTLTAGGATGTLVATVAPATATNKSVTWSSSAPAVATVSVNGVVTPLTAGTTNITVTTVDGSFTATCAVTVTLTPVTITIAAIPGVTAPVTGAAPDLTVTAITQYTGTVTWFPAHNPFQAATQYTATITLTAQTGYTLSGVAANFFTVAGATSDTNSANSGVVTAPFPAAAPVIATVSTIANAAVAPTVAVTGTNFKATIAASDLTVGVGTTGLTLGTVTYVSATQITVAFTGTAAAGNVTIQAKTSAFTPAGVAASNTLTITVPAAAPVIATVSTIALGESNPTVTVTGTGFKVGIAASDLTVGVGVTDLTLGTVTRVSATQITVAFTGTAVAGDVTIQAKTSAFTPAAGAVSNTLTVTVPTTITIAAIPGVTAPATGETPVDTITETDQYTGTVTWWPEHATFAGATAYTARITLTTKAGYTLTGVAENFFTVAVATSDTNPADSGVVTALFTATAAPVIATDSTIANAAVAPTVAVTGTDFRSDIVTGDLTVIVTPSSFIFSDVTWVSAMEITVAFTETADSGDVVTIQANTSAFDPAAGAASNTLTVTVAAP